MSTDNTPKPPIVELSDGSRWRVASTMIVRADEPHYGIAECGARWYAADDTRPPDPLAVEQFLMQGGWEPLTFSHVEEKHPDPGYLSEDSSAAVALLSLPNGDRVRLNAGWWARWHQDSLSAAPIRTDPWSRAYVVRVVRDGTLIAVIASHRARPEDKA